MSADRKPPKYAGINLSDRPIIRTAIIRPISVRNALRNLLFYFNVFARFYRFATP